MSMAKFFFFFVSIIVVIMMIYFAVVFCCFFPLNLIFSILNVKIETNKKNIGRFLFSCSENHCSKFKIFVCLSHSHTHKRIIIIYRKKDNIWHTHTHEKRRGCDDLKKKIFFQHIKIIEQIRDFFVVVVAVSFFLFFFFTADPTHEQNLHKNIRRWWWWWWWLKGFRFCFLFLLLCFCVCVGWWFTATSVLQFLTIAMALEVLNTHIHTHWMNELLWTWIKIDTFEVNKKKMNKKLVVAMELI